MLGTCLLLMSLVPGAYSGEVEVSARSALTEGNAALERANSDSSQNLVAALLFAKALPAYEAAGDHETAAEIRSVLFWCKKRMDLATLERFVATKGEEGQQLTTVLSVVDQAPPASEAGAYLAKAEAFAQKNPGQALKVAIRYFEVANRFQGSPESLRAQRLSLDALQQVMATSGRADQTVATGIHSIPITAADLPEATQKVVDVSNKAVDVIAVKVSQDMGAERKRAIDTLLKEAEAAQRKGELEQVMAHQKQAADLDTDVRGTSKVAGAALEAYRKARDKAIAKAAAEVVAERRKLVQALGKAQKEETKKGNTSGALAIKQAIDDISAQVEQASAASLAGVKEVVRPFVLHPEGGIFLGKLPMKKSEGPEIFIAKDAESAKKVVMIDGGRCLEYIFAHAPSALTYDVPPGTKQFTAYALSTGYQSVKFSVVLDGKSVFTSNNPSAYEQKMVPINIMIPEGTKRMELIVDPCGDNVADHSLWAFPYFSR